ncbi:MAG: tRNA (adenosine(37)-N6)-threonylcarbamoyltransferase complex dimerization subunit type 1 TsaB [bacterium]|nr:tRNA (adenosine(37)-N6)-threonylcarbamoyltransferase complex dimerization subunit type 1 TsaB [bacterium]
MHSREKDRCIVGVVESSWKRSSIAVYSGTELLHSEWIGQELCSSASIFPAFSAALRNLSLRPADIDLFIVSQGPGSFTGVRSGIAFAQGMKLAGAQVCGVSLLSAMLDQATSDCVCCHYIANKTEHYVAAYASSHLCGRDSTLFAAGRYWSELAAPETVEASELGNFAERVFAPLSSAGSDTEWQFLQGEQLFGQLTPAQILGQAVIARMQEAGGSLFHLPLQPCYVKRVRALTLIERGKVYSG